MIRPTLALALLLSTALPTAADQTFVPSAFTDDDDDDAGGGDDDAGDDDDDGARGAIPVRQADDDDDGPGGEGPGDDDGRGDDGDDDDDDGIDDDDPEYARYAGPDGPRALNNDEILDSNGDLARRAEIAALGAPDWALRRARRLGFTVIEAIALDGLGTSVTILAAPRGLTVREALARLRSGDGETIYDYNHFYSYRPTMAGRAEPAPEAPRRTPLTMRADIAIGLIDAVVDTRHAALDARLIETRSFSPDARAATTDHGTSVAGLLVGRETGFAPHAKLYAAGVFSASAGGEAVSAALELVRALDWMVENDVAVINMSLAGPDNALLRAAVARAVARGHLVVAAVGNDGPNARPLFPAAYDGVVGVTAVDADNRVYRLAARGPQVDLAAPGVDVISAAGTGYARQTGTSFAAPHVAAVLAARVTGLSPDAAKAALAAVIAEADDLGTAGRDDTYGHGLAPGGRSVAVD